MRHFIDGWLVESFDGTYGRVVDSATSKASGRGAVEDSGFRIPGRRGKTPVFSEQPAESYYTLSVTCVADSYVEARRLVAGVHARIPTSRAVELRRADDGLDVFAAATVLASTEIEGKGGGNHVLTLKLTFQLPGGVWLDTAPISATVPDGVSDITEMWGGSAPMECTFTITGNGSNTNVEITDVESGAWWRLVGNIDPGVVVTVDPLAHSATGTSTDFTSMLTVGDRPFYLAPDARIEQVRNGPQLTMIRTRRAWYE